MILHAVWTRRTLHLWIEGRPETIESETVPATHPHACPAGEIARIVAEALHAAGPGTDRPGDGLGEATEIELLLPHAEGEGVLPSPRMLALVGTDPTDRPVTLQQVRVPAIAVAADRGVPILLGLEQLEEHRLLLGNDLRFWTSLARSTAEWLSDQRVVPTLVAEAPGRLEASWSHWAGDRDSRHRLELLAAGMPMAARCGRESPGDAASVLDQCLAAWTDALVRSTLAEHDFGEALEEWRGSDDPHVVWLRGLLGPTGRIDAEGLELPRRVRTWLSRLETDAPSGRNRLALRIEEPAASSFDEDRSGEVVWQIRFGLADPAVTDDERFGSWLAAEDIWAGQFATPAGGTPMEEVLLTELAAAARIWTPIERSLSDATPSGLALSTREIHALLSEHRPILEEAGIRVEVPAWWGDPSHRLGVKLHLDGEESPGGTGLDRVVNYRWDLVLGGESISFERFRSLAADGVPLVRLDGRWVEIRPDDLAAAKAFLERGISGQASLGEALRMAHGFDAAESALPRLGVEATGWIADLIDGTSEARFEAIEPPDAFLGELRPYQRSGLSWLAFLDRLGLGACLADDMGLGKTIQLIALLQHERLDGARPGPTLIVAPMSVVGNWQREIGRFAPELSVHRHHGLDRPMGDRFVEIAGASDVVLTTYGLVGRDLELLQRQHWRRVVLDEAQHVKNPPTRQASAIRSLPCSQRIALTGTPVENRLSELWSIMDFCCPGYLGTSGDFRRRFAVPIERHRDPMQAERLRSLVRPFVLRRLKTDPTVISDLPPLVESRQQVPLTDEQTTLYESAVSGMLRNIDETTGMRRKGLVLAGLVRLKQICNHPAHFLGERLGESSSADAFASRSGKTLRLMEMLEEMIAAGDRALLFTQYREMGHLLAPLLRKAFDIDPIFLHGGVTSAKREQLVDRFQSDDPSCPIFILSLRAGGVGLNLTSARHVIHYDRWWNPAVENQATDRAFRIGQTRTVHVHKMIASGTLEERIDRMIEEKIELAKQVIGSGESWLTELSTNQLRDLLQLRDGTLEEATA